MKKCYLEYLSQFEVYLDHMSKSLKLSGHLTNENGDDVDDDEDNDDEDDDDDDDYEIESNDYDDDPVDVNYQHHHHHHRRINDLKSASARRKKLLSSNSGHNSTSHHQSNMNDLELDNLSDLSDNFTTSNISSEIIIKKPPTATSKTMTMASFRQMSSTDSEKGRIKDDAAASKRHTTNTNKIERVTNNGGSYKMAWM